MHQLAEKRNSPLLDAQVAVATCQREPHTGAMLGLAWIVFIAECILSAFFGFILWHFWTHSAMERKVAIRATLMYASGCVAFLLLTLFLPL